MDILQAHQRKGHGNIININTNLKLLLFKERKCELSLFARVLFHLGAFWSTDLAF